MNRHVVPGVIVALGVAIVVLAPVISGAATERAVATAGAVYCAIGVVAGALRARGRSPIRSFQFALVAGCLVVIVLFGVRLVRRSLATGGEFKPASLLSSLIDVAPELVLPYVVATVALIAVATTNRRWWIAFLAPVAPFVLATAYVPVASSEFVSGVVWWIAIRSTVLGFVLGVPLLVLVWVGAEPQTSDTGLESGSQAAR